MQGQVHGAPVQPRCRKKAEDAKVCIDQFEFPDIPCAYPSFGSCAGSR